MKHLFYVLLFSPLLPTGMQAQSHHNYELYNNGAQIFVGTGTDVGINGDMHQIGGSLNNNGAIKVQGNLYSNTAFQQRGTGTILLQNDFVNPGEQQFIAGSYAVRGGTAATGSNDGSFYNLALGNDQGIVWLNGTGNVADVRNNVDFALPGRPINRIITHNPASLPANGSAYDAVFGLMDPAPGLGGMNGNTVSSNGNMSNVDSGYVQGKLRRAISATGGSYGYVLGLEPAGGGAARGVQYVRLDFAANNYDVVTGYFQQGSNNTIPGTPTECGYNITYFGGVDHGEWVFDDLTGLGSGPYEVAIWPQDHNASAMSVWFVTKDNAISGTANDCGPSLIGLDRAGFNGFSEFGFAGGSIILPVTVAYLDAIPVENQFIQVQWNTVEEINLEKFEVQRSLDNLNFSAIGEEPAIGVTTLSTAYSFDDINVAKGIPYYYRLKMIDIDGDFSFTESVSASLLPDDQHFSIEMYPNPVRDEGLNIRVQAAESDDLELFVVDALGRIIRRFDFAVEPGVNLLQISTTEFAVGPYMLRISTQGFSETRKFIKTDNW